ncbi:MAG TPA: tetratricopeptide repeat protein [Candidatus Omnitrophota bacterium]|nr:tetratricopeptide repeat protein [Candidatus Omnitrophota bacterium]
MRNNLRVKKLWVLIILFLSVTGGIAWRGRLSAESVREANERGVAYMEQRRYKQAVDEFEKAFHSDPENKVVRENLAIAYNQLAVSLIEKERYLEAREYLEKAVDLKPDEPKIRDNLAAVYAKTAMGEREEREAIAEAKGKDASPADFRALSDEEAANQKISGDFLMQGIRAFEKKEYGMAKEMLEEALRYSDKNPTVFELLGDIAYYEQDLKTAKSRYVEAFRLKNSSRIREKIEKLSREAPIETQLDQYSDEHFIIRYKKNVTQPFGGGYEIREYLREAWGAISKDFGVYPKDKTVVLLYNEEEYRYLSGSPAWVGGQYDGKIRLPAYKQKIDSSKLKKLVWHELTHYFVYEISQGKCPRWLNEGLAQYEENKIVPIDIRYFEAAEKNKYLLPFEDLDRGISESSDPTEVFLFYQQSFMVTSSLISKYRMFKVKEMLEEYAKGATTEQVFERALQTSFRAFEIKWLASLGKKSGR